MTKISALTPLGDGLAVGDQFIIRDIDDAGTPNKSVTISGITRGLDRGTNAAPAIAFAADKNTGIYSPGEDQLAVATNGTGRLFVDASGNVGVGIAAPEGVFDINRIADGGIGPILNIRNATATGTSNTKGEIRFHQRDAVSNARYSAIGAGCADTFSRDGYLYFSTNAGTSAPAERMRLDSSGLLGLGTSSPGAKLEVAGDVIFNGGGVQFPIQFANAFTPNSQRADLLFSANATSNNAFRVGTIASNGGVTLQGTRQSDSSQKVNLVLQPDGGSVGIGTTSPSSSLVVSNGGANGIEFGPINGDIFTYNRSTSAYTNTQITCNEFVVRTNGSNERARIDSSGRLLVGTSTARSNFFNSTNSARLQIEGSGSNNNYALSIVSNYAGSTNGAQVILAKSGGSNVGDNTLVSDGNTIGQVTFQGADGTDFVEAARISAEVDGTPGANDMPGRLLFSTTADGAASPTERMRITNGGNILINATSVVNQGLVLISYSGVSNQGAIFADSSTASGNVAILFKVAGTGVGSITTTSSSTAYNTISDYRLKENVVPLTGAAARLNQLQVHRFNFIADPGKTVDGFIAHEAQTVVPEAVHGTKDEVDNECNPVYQGIDQSKLVPLLTAALQEAIGRIETLEARLTAAGIE